MVSLVWVSLAVAVLVASLVSLLHRHGDGRKKDGKALPPGPPALVFLAKFLALRRSIFELGPLLRELHARHGPVVSVRLLVRTHVFVADRRLAHRALVQGGATFADRPPPVDPSLTIMFSGDIGSAPYGAYWRVVRRNLAGEALQTSRVISLYAPARERVCDRLVTKLLRSNKEDNTSKEVVVTTLRPLLRRAMFELLVYMCFGAWLSDEFLDKIEQTQHQILLCVTAFPMFAFLPSITKRIFHGRWAELVAVRRRQEQLFLPLIHHHHSSNNSQRQQAQDPPSPCYADTLLKLRVPDDEEGGDRPLTDSEMVSLCAEFLDGGTDTTVTLVEWIMAELVNNPDVQAKLRRELVQKQASTATQQALQEMPYLKAVVMEGLRLHPPGHFLLPHGAQTDSDIAGYTVPKGAELNFPVAEMGRDGAVWPAPTEFRPERFLDGGEGSGVDITGSREIKMMPFGAGRRICPGYALGMHHAEYFVARMVRDLQWLPPPPPPVVDVQGQHQHQQAVHMEEVLDHTTVMKHPLRARIVILPSQK